MKKQHANMWDAAKPEQTGNLKTLNAYVRK